MIGEVQAADGVAEVAELAIGLTEVGLDGRTARVGAGADGAEQVAGGEVVGAGGGGGEAVAVEAVVGFEHVLAPIHNYQPLRAGADRVLDGLSGAGQLYSRPAGQSLWRLLGARAGFPSYSRQPPTPALGEQN